MGKPRKPVKNIHINWGPQDRQYTLLKVCGLSYPWDGGAGPSAPVADVIGYGGAAGGGKALTLDTPLPTPSGWVRMGDVMPGDVIFDNQGMPCHVLAVSDVMYGHDIYEIKFDDGSTIKADRDHRWLTFDYAERAKLLRRTTEYREKRKKNRPSRGKGRRPDLAERNKTRKYDYLPYPSGTIRTTREIFDTLCIKSRVNHAIPVASPIKLPSVDLPLDPYLLGCWLGDGNTYYGRITTSDKEIINAFINSGFNVVNYYDYEYGIHGLQTLLREIGVLGKKHIPVQYLRASIEQRRALLEGLMDTDGTVLPDGSCEFYTTSYELALNMHELLVSLGIKCKICEGRAKLYGKDCGPKYRIKFRPDFFVFRLHRKREKQKLGTRKTRKWRYIVDIRRIDSEPVRCIQVDSPSHLYLAGNSFIPTHNSDGLLGIAMIGGCSWPGISIGYFRREYPMLEGPGGAILRSHELMSSWAAWNGSERRWAFPNGSILQFCHASDELDVHKYQSQQFDILLIDEATQFTRYQYRYLLTRNRATRDGVTPFAVLATNPGGIGHAWFFAEFVNIGTPEEVHSVEVEPGTYEKHLFLPAKLSDNIILERRDPRYRKILEAQPEIIRRQLLEGDWNAFAGQYFKSWRRDIHVIPTPKPIEKWLNETIHHRKFRCLDYGLDMTACYWIDVGQDGRLIVYRELYEPNLTLSQAARRIVAATTSLEEIKYTVASPDLWNRRQDVGRSGMEIMAENGLRGLIKADNRRVEGWWNLLEFLEPAKDPESDKMTAQLRFFDVCANAIRTIPSLVADENNPNDVSDKCEDHAAEAIRYGCMSRPKPSNWRPDPLEDLKKCYPEWTPEYQIHSREIMRGDPKREIGLEDLGM